MARTVYLVRTTRPKNMGNVKRKTLATSDGATYTVCEPYSAKELRGVAKSLGTRVRKSQSVEHTRKRLARKDTDNKFGLRIAKKTDTVPV